MIGWSRQAEVDLSDYLTSGGNFKTALLEIASAYLSGNNFKVIIEELAGTLKSTGGRFSVSIDEAGIIMPVSLDNDNIGLIDILNTINDSLSPLSDDTTKGILRSIGDAGDSPTNTTGKTVLQLLTETLAQLDITLSALRDALLGTDSKTLTDLYDKAYDSSNDRIKVDVQTVANPSNLDVALSTRASETTLSSILNQLDIALSVLRDALLGADSKTLTDLYNKAYDSGQDRIKVKIEDSSIAVPSDLQYSYIAYDGDLDAFKSVETLKISTETFEIDTSTDTSPQTLLTPSSGKKLEVRGVFIFSDSTSGEVEVIFPTSNKKVGKIYCSRYYQTQLPKIKISGAIDESLQAQWSTLSTNAKIFIVVNYIEK